jgi:hypothetical protein
MEVPVTGHTDADWLDQYVDRIQFWSYTLFKVRPGDYATKFRVYTQNHIPEAALRKMLIQRMPGCQVYICWGYKLRNTFDVRFREPVRWDTFIWRCVQALEGYL